MTFTESRWAYNESPNWKAIPSVRFKGTRNPAKASSGRPYETGSRNMAATKKWTFWPWFPIHSFRHFLARTHRFATIQNVTDRQQTTDRQTDRRQTTHCTIGSTDSTVGQKSTFWPQFPIHSFRHFFARMYRFATIQNVTDDRQTDRQTTHRSKGTTDSTVGQKLATCSTESVLDRRSSYLRELIWQAS